MNIQNITIGRVAFAAAVTGGLGLLFLVVMFAFQMTGLSPVFFGTLNDIANGVMALLGSVLAVLLFTHYRAQFGLPHYLFLVLAILGGAVAIWGSVLVISSRTGFVLAGLYSAAGFGLIGFWLAAFCIALRGSSTLSPGFITYGIVTGVTMALGLGGLPSLVRGADGFEQIPLFQSILWSTGSLAWLILQPIWYFLLSRVMLKAV